MNNTAISQTASAHPVASHPQTLDSTRGKNNNQSKPQEFPSFWRQFTPGAWCRNIDVRDFIQQNYRLYDGDASFLAAATDRSLKLWQRVADILEEERKANGLLAVDTDTPASILAFKPGYIDKDLEIIVGLQTDAPRKRAMMPRGGIRTVIQALESYGQQISPEVKAVFTKHTKTHNDGVFSVYTKEMLKARSSGVITGLPDAYGRGRIIGDYRRVALYGTTRLIAEKKQELASLEDVGMTEDNIRLREELSEQISSLKELDAMAKMYGFDISLPAENARQAVQWLYFGYLAAIKEQDGAAMSLGRVSTFLDIYFERDIAEGLISETEAQEIIDDFVIKLRLVCFLRPPAYNALFSGDPTWVTEAIGGVGLDGRSLVTKSSFRMLQTLRNLGAAPEPNLTVLWSQNLPEGFKRFATEISIETSSVQYQNDDMMRNYWGDDYAIACCVSAMKIGKQMQFFGARANLAKALLYAINGGRDELSGEQVTPLLKPITSDVLDYNEVQKHFDQMLSWLAKTYVNTLNVIHYMHDKYNYERLEMALHDRDILRTMACGIAGLSVVVDSLSAIKYAKVSTVRNKDGLVVDYQIDGDFPKFGNGDARVDVLAAEITELFMNKLRQQTIYRQAMPTQSVLTITSNVVYGQKTGNTPDGRKTGEPFAPGANPMHGRDTNGAVASMLSVASIPYEHCQDGISYTFSIIPKALGRNTSVQVANLVGLLDGYFGSNGHHVNVNVFNVETLKDAMENPEKYPQLTIRVSGYAVNFIKLSRDQQLDVISRTIHASV